MVVYGKGGFSIHHVLVSPVFFFFFFFFLLPLSLVRLIKNGTKLLLRIDCNIISIKKNTGKTFFQQPKTVRQLHYFTCCLSNHKTGILFDKPISDVTIRSTVVKASFSESSLQVIYSTNTGSSLTDNPLLLYAAGQDTRRPGGSSKFSNNLGAVCYY